MSRQPLATPRDGPAAAGAGAEKPDDGLNRRVRKLLGTDPSNPTERYDYYYNTNWQLLEVHKDGDTDHPIERYYWNTTYIDASILRHWDSDTDGTAEGTTYYLYDASFNVTALTNLYGEVLERYLYDPYGKVTIMDDSWNTRSSSSYANTVLFQGRERDVDTGLHDFRNRMYHPTLGRWLQRDPAGYVDGMGLYEFVMGNPLTGLAPQGLWVGHHHSA